MNLFVEGKDLSFSAKGYLCFDDKLPFYQVKNFFSPRKVKKRTDISMPIPAVEVAKHFAQLYFLSGEQFHCTLTKIEKLITIAELIRLKDGQENLIFENILIKNCGVGIEGLEFDLPNIILDKRDENRETGETDLPIGSVTYNQSFPGYFKHAEGIIIEDDVNTLLTNVFERFGNYKARTLGMQIDEFKSFISETTNSSIGRCINKNRVHEFFQMPLEQLSQNQVYCYIKNYVEL